jgi:DNA-binding beta-propeller fold protein YncE
MVDLKGGSALTFISSIIGSGLVVTVLTTLIAGFNQPHVYLNVVPHLFPYYSDESTEQIPHKVQYYEVIARNDGRVSANHVKLSLFFFGRIMNYSSALYSENMTLNPEPIKSQMLQSQSNNYPQIKNQNLDQQSKNGVPSLLVANIPRFAKDAMIIIYVWTDTDETDPFYVSATYDQGSNEYPSPALKDPQFNALRNASFNYPSILSGRSDVPLDEQILIGASILSVIFFAIALIHKRIRGITKNDNAKFATELEDELTTIHNIIEKNPGYDQILHSDTWDSKNNDIKRQIFNSDDYKCVNNFYRRLKERNFQALQKKTGETITPYNKDCFDLVNQALNIDWPHYINASDKGVRVDHFLAIPIIIISSIFIISISEYFPYTFLGLVQPIDLTLPSVSLFTQLQTIDGRFFTQYELLIYSIIFVSIAFIVRSIIAFVIAREIAKRLIYSSSADNSREFDAVFKLRTSKLLRYSFLIMGLPLYSIIKLFFSQSLSLPPLYLFIIVLAIDIVRMYVLAVVVPKISIKQETVIKGLYYIAAASAAAAGILYIVVGYNIVRVLTGIIASYKDRYATSQTTYLYDIYLFNLFLIFFVIIGIIQIAWILPMIKQRRRWCYIGITGSIISILSWLIFRMIMSYTFIDNPTLPYVSSLGLLIILVHFVYAISNIIILYKERQIRRIIAKPTSKKTLFSKLVTKYTIINPTTSTVILTASLAVSSLVIGSIVAYPVSIGMNDLFRPHYLYPVALDINPKTNLAYVSYSNYDNVSVIDTTNDRILRNITTGTSANYDQDVAVNPNTNMIYVTNSNYGYDSISVIDGKTNNVLKNINLITTSTSFNNIYHMAVNPNTNMIYVTNSNYGNDSISVIDGKTNNVLKNINLTTTTTDIAVNPKTNMIYTIGGHYPTIIDAINGTTYDITEVATINAGTANLGIAVNPRTNVVYALTGEYPNPIYVINGVTNNIIDKVKMHNEPTNMAINPNINRLYVTKIGQHVLSIIDTSTNKLIR